MPEPPEYRGPPRDDHASPTREVHAQAEGKGKERKGKELKRESSKPKKHVFEGAHFDLALWMSNPVKARFGDKQKINLDQWADTVRKLFEIDKNTEEEIKTVWSFIVNHDEGSFSWAENIRTPMKLRQSKDGMTYFEKIKNQIQRQNYAGQNQAGVLFDEYDPEFERIRRKHGLDANEPNLGQPNGQLPSMAEFGQQEPGRVLEVIPSPAVRRHD